ncbi:MAG: DUF1957 domain-containing protein [Candidatus Lokiarchaeota archaeon]|nr:DUF1957 domain-containing protein [Candidatus Lokiarchaeota archaeon]MBD3341027.1 DUF1957 domain-containing protein [Candidatus Lokiarchaeota archaeon]
MSLGYFGLVLHGHIPWCKKSGTWPAGEEWLFEAMNETYIPMLDVLRELKEEGIKTALTINITPILAEQLADEYMKQRFTEYMEDLIKRVKKDIERFVHQTNRLEIAKYHLNRFETVLNSFYQNYYRDINGSFKWLQDEGMIELITCGATHGFLPLMEHDSGIFSQIQLAVDTHMKHFGKHPRGIWLPECAYRPKIEENGKIRESVDYWLKNSNIEYFFVDTHGILDAQIIESRNDIGLDSRFGYKLNTNVSVFGRNRRTSRQVWDAKIGYPGDGDYREFHKKDSQSGLHYWKITDKEKPKENKELYEVSKAERKVIDHAEDFVSLLKDELKDFKEKYRRKGIIVSPYDFELYGHWWMEGIDWLKQVFKNIVKSKKIEMMTFSEFLDKNRDEFTLIRMNESSWGAGGHFEVWKNPEHGWIWPYINASIIDFENVLHRIPKPSSERKSRILKQTGRELLLMEGSDWPFLLYTKQAKEYANERFHHHHQRFNKLIWAAKDPYDYSRLPYEELEKIESIDSCFFDLNIEYFKRIP